MIMTYNKNLIIKVLVVAILSAIATEIRFHPFPDSPFRVALGVITFVVALLLFKEIPILLTSGLMTVSVLCLRVGLDLIFVDINVFNSIILHFPGAFYYTILGGFMKIFNIRELDASPFLQGALLGCLDFSSNMIELLIRILTGFHSLEEPIVLQALTLFVLGVVRMSFVTATLTTLRHNRLRAQHEIEQRKVKDLLLLTSNLQAEVFFLQKSSTDIENLMKKSYQLYQNLLETQQLQFGKRALEISTKSHEIKKDYQRINAGLKKLVNPPEQKIFSYVEILNMVIDSNRDYAKQDLKEISFTHRMEQNFLPKSPLILTSIFNNLITNAVEAIDKTGKITITQRIDHLNQNGIISIKDTGSGIKSADLEYIFTPGFSDKWEESTGEFSTGVGLCHVNNLVHQLSGELHVDSALNQGTVFTIVIPFQKLIKEWY